jgi:F-type H+-transporting ATPase subunit b
MLIDGFTFFAQIINFLILMFLLKRFLYKPIVNAMQEREHRIVSRLKEADDKLAEAEQEAQAYRQKNEALEERREAILRQANAEADALRKDMLHQAREEIHQVKTHWHQAIQQEKESFLRELRLRTSEQACQVIRQALADLANVDLERQIAQVFLQRLKELKGESRAEIASVFPGSFSNITIRSAFDIPEDLQEQILSVVNHHFAERAGVSYEVSPDVLCGVEMRVPGHKIGWSLGSYLLSMEETLMATLDVKSVEA